MSPSTLVWICLASAGWAFGFGVGSQACTHWLKHQAVSDTLIGLNHACYYLGVALGSMIAPRLAKGRGLRCAGWGIFASGVTLMLFPVSSGPAGWFALRLANGLASALSLIPIETIVSRDSASEQRTRNFGFYAVALTLGGAIGIGLGLHCYAPGSSVAFYLGGTLPLCASVGLLMTKPSGARGEYGEESPPSIHPTRRFLSYGTAWCQGFLEGGMLAFLSLYLLSRGLSADMAGALMGVTMVGVIAFQVPVSWLADRWGPLAVLLGCYAFTLAGLAAVPWCSSGPWLATCLFIFGACSGAMYPLGLSLLGDAGSEQHLARAYAGYMVVECVGSQLGAAAMGSARDAWGEQAMFAVGSAALLGVLLSWLALCGLYRRATRTKTTASLPKERLRCLDPGISGFAKAKHGTNAIRSTFVG
jgi:MFS family permease